MKLHAPHTKPDWELTGPQKVTLWQRLALRTNGLITPANVLSITGVGLVLWGAWQLGLDRRWLFGVCLVAIGRCFDVLDGYVAERTKTKSRLGGAIDVICDKLAMLTILIAAVYAHLVWPWFVGLLVLYNVYLAYFGALQGRVHRIYPNSFAKLASFVSWLAIFVSIFHSKEDSFWFAFGTFIAICLWATLAVMAIRAYHRQLQLADAKGENTDWSQTITDLVCIGNPHATHYRKAQKLLYSLGEVLHKKPVEIAIADHQQKLKKILAAAGPQNKILIAVAGGDGTVNVAINTLLQLQDEYTAGRCILLPLWGGNANDFAYMLNGLHVFAHPKRLTQQTRSVSVPLIKLKLTEPHKQAYTAYAACYASFGATAYAARQLEAHRFSTKKISQWFPLLLIGREIVAVVRALVSTPQYTSEIDEKEEPFYEHSLINGPRIAKINRVPVSLGQPYFLHAAITRKDPAVLVSLLRMAMGRPTAEYSMRNQLSFKLVTAVDAQIDGEVMHLPAGTQVAASSVQTSLRFVSSKLH